MGLYTFLYENLLYRLYIIHIQPPLLVTARLSRYTAHTAYTAIQPYTPYIIQRYTASLRGSHDSWSRMVNDRREDHVAVGDEVAQVVELGGGRAILVDAAKADPHRHLPMPSGSARSSMCGWRVSPSSSSPAARGVRAYVAVVCAVSLPNGRTPLVAG